MLNSDQVTKYTKILEDKADSELGDAKVIKDAALLMLRGYPHIDPNNTEIQANTERLIFEAFKDLASISDRTYFAPVLRQLAIDILGADSSVQPARRLGRLSR